MALVMDVINLFKYLMGVTAKIIFIPSQCLYVALDYACMWHSIM